jgi:CRISPR/Cas system-associated exonuclease Cas4 (RecB family)
MASTVSPPSIKSLLELGFRNMQDRKHERWRAAHGVPAGAPDPPRTGLYISEVRKVVGDSACWRALFYDVHEAPRNPLTFEQMQNFEIGDRLEYMYDDALAVSGALEKVQVPIRVPAPVSGRLDVLLRTDRRVVEIKTATVKMWSKLPKQEHLDQTLLYIDGLRRLDTYGDVREGVLAYVAKDAPKAHEGVREYPVQWDAAHVEEILEAYHLAWIVASGDTIPPRPKGYSPNAWPCFWCSYSSQCWSTDG